MAGIAGMPAGALTQMTGRETGRLLGKGFESSYRPPNYAGRKIPLWINRPASFTANQAVD